MGWIHGGEEWHEDGRGETVSALDEKLEAKARAREAAIHAAREAAALQAAHIALERATARTLPPFENVGQLRKLTAIFRTAATAHPEILGTLQECLLASYETYQAKGGRDIDRVEWLLEVFHIASRFTGDESWNYSPRPMTREEALAEMAESEAASRRMAEKYGRKAEEYRLVSEAEYNSLKED